MNNLLLGGTGFIGSALGLELISRGEKVTSVSRSGQGDSPGVRSVVVDLYRQRCPQDILEAADNIFILNIGRIHEGFDADREKQVVLDLVEALRTTHSRVLYFSSVAVYGNTRAKANESSLCQPIGNYGKFKLEATGIFKKNIAPERLTVLRLANIYGAPKNRGFIGILMDKLSEPNPTMYVNGDGQQRRDYVFIDDLIQAIMAIISKPEQNGILISVPCLE